MSQDYEITTLSGCLARAFWFALGPALMGICVVVIALTPQVTFPGVLDIVYAGLLAVVIVARIFDRPPKAKADEPEGTASSEYKAGLGSALKYISTLSFIAIGLWALAHFVVKRLL